MKTGLTQLRRRLADDRGNGIVEFVFVAVVVMVPLVYLVVSIASVQRSNLAVTNAAREAGRAMATTPAGEDPMARAAVAVRLALGDQGLPDDAVLTTVAVSGTCTAASTPPPDAPGTEYAVCVMRGAFLPGVPSIFAGRGISTTGRFVVHTDDYRGRGSAG